MIGYEYRNLFNSSLFRGFMCGILFVQFVTLCDWLQIDWQLVLTALRDSGLVVPFPTIVFKS